MKKLLLITLLSFAIAPSTHCSLTKPIISGISTVFTGVIAAGIYIYAANPPLVHDLISTSDIPKKNKPLIKDIYTSCRPVLYGSSAVFGAASLYCFVQTIRSIA